MEKLDTIFKTIFSTIRQAGENLDQPVYVIGGFVRDYYLERLQEGDATDLDFVTVGSGIELAEEAAKLLNVRKVVTYRNFGTAHFRYKNIDLEFVGARKESYQRDSRKPLVEDGSLVDDLERRDLTINTLSWSLNSEDYGELVDPSEGIEDLKNKIIRTPVEPDRTFDDDPLRMLRTIRFASQLKFSIEENTYNAIKKMADRIKIVSKERIVDELNKILMSTKPSIGFSHLLNTGLSKHFLQELDKLHGVEEVEGVSHKDNLWHTLEVLDNVAEKSDSLWLRWAALLHDVAKPATKKFVSGTGWTFHGHDALGAKLAKSIFRRLGLPLDERMHYVRKLIRLHLRPIALASEEVTDSAIRRLIYEAGNDTDDLMLLCRADITSKNEYKVAQFLKNFDKVERKINEVEEKDRIRNWKNPISGNEIMHALEIKPGPVIGEIKEAIKEAILNGDIPNEHDAAYDYMLRIKDQYLTASTKNHD